MHNGPLSKHRVQIWNLNQHPYKHTLSEFSYINPALPGVTNLQSTIDWMLAVFYPNTKLPVATQATLPLVGNTISDYRVVLDDGDGKAASYRWEQREGEAAPSWHKVYDMDWGQDSILTNFLNVTQDLYVYKNGKTDIDGAGNPIIGIYAGQTQYGGNTANQNLTLKANSGDGVGPRTGFVQTDDNLRPTVDSLLSIGTITEKFLNIYLAGFARISTMNLQSGQITDTTGTISFDNENLITTGDVTGDSATFTDAQIGSINVFNNVLTSDTNIISMLLQTVKDLANLITTQLTIGNGSDTLVLTTNAVRSLYNSSAGVHNFNSQNLQAINNLVATYIESTTSKFGNFTFAGNTIANPNPSTFATPLLNVADIAGVNADFTTLQAIAFGELGNYRFGGSEATTLLLNSDFILNASGAGKVVTRKDLLPQTDNNLDLGSSSQRFNDLFLGQNLSNGTLSIAMQTLLSFRDALAGAATGDSLFYDVATQRWLASNPDTEINHDTLNNLTTGDAGHTQFAMLNGRSGGQNLAGGTAAAQDLVLESTSNAAKGLVKFKDVLAPFTTGTDFGTNSLKIKDVYASGENKGLRDENTAIANNFNAGSVGRKYYNTSAEQGYVDAGSFAKYAVHTDTVTDSVTTGAAATVPFNLASVVNLTNTSLVSISNLGIQADVRGNRIKFLVNKTTNPVTVLNNSNISTGTGFNFVIQPDYGVVVFYNGMSWNMISGGGSSASGGVTNLIVNGNADTAPSSIFTPYADAAGARPVDGIGGSPAVTTSLTTTTPLVGTKSFILTKPATNCQGQGWSVLNTPLDFAYRGKSLKISFDYVVNSGTFIAGSNNVDGDIIWTFFDITNSKIVEPSNIKMFSNSTTITDKFEASVQFDTNCLAFRLIGHVASASALAYELEIDNVTVSPQNYVYGTPITEPISYIPTFTGFGAPLAVDFNYKVIGDCLEIFGNFTPNGVTSVEARVSLPSGYVSADSAKLPVLSVKGFGGTARVIPDVLQVLIEREVSYMTFAVANSSLSGLAKSTGANFATVPISFFAKIPVKGLSASTRMSDGFDGRSIVVSAHPNSGIAIGTNGIIPLTNIIKDNCGIVSGNQIRVPSGGDYIARNGISTNSTTSFTVRKNGSVFKIIGTANSGFANGGSVLLPNLVAGDLIEFALDTAATVNGSAILTLDFYKLQSPQVISAGEKIFAKYSSSAGQSIAFNTSVQLVHSIREKDSHGAYNPTTGVFICPTAGDYRITGAMTFNSFAAANAPNAVLLAAARNSVAVSEMGRSVASGTSQQCASGSAVIPNCLAGDALTVLGYQGANVSTQSLIALAVSNHVSFERI